VFRKIRKDLPQVAHARRATSQSVRREDEQDIPPQRRPGLVKLQQRGNHQRSGTLPFRNAAAGEHSVFLAQ